MKIISHKSPSSRIRALTLVEVLVAVAVVGIAVIALYLSISSGFRVVQSARENLRATQIMVERLETIRLYRWGQVTNSAFVGTGFTNYYNHVDESGFPYVGSIAIVPAVLDGESYLEDMRQISITLQWTSGGVSKSRTMQSLIARRGIQNYVY